MGHDAASLGLGWAAWPKRRGGRAARALAGSRGGAERRLVAEVLYGGARGLGGGGARLLLGGGVGEDLARDGLVLVLQLLAQIVVDVGVLGREHRSRDPCLARAPCAADAVRVVLDVLGAVEVDHVLHPADVDAAPCDVCADEDVGHAVLEVVERLLAGLLGAPGVQHRRLEALLGEVAVERVRHLARVDEHHDGRLLAPEHVEEPVLLLRLGAEAEVLRHGVGRLPRLAHRHVDGPPQVLARDALHGRRHGGREHEGLAELEVGVAGLGVLLVGLHGPRGHRIQDLLHLGLEAHVDHAVGLVQHDVVALVEDAEAALEGVDEAARGGDDDLDALADGEALLLDALDAAAADEREAPHAHVLAEGHRLVVDLVGQLARGGQHQRLGALAGVLGGDFGLLGDVDEHGQHEGGGLARARLRDAHHVAVVEPQRDALHLDRRRHLVPLLRHRAQDLLRQPALGPVADGVGHAPSPRRDLEVLAEDAPVADAHLPHLLLLPVAAGQLHGAVRAGLGARRVRLLHATPLLLFHSPLLR
mmetsp:Transcript_58621/g.154989  ORF Transcript_58621/g.154989 Transcript_58621/m.154989 type:complete len:533 (-) Transcript_58621:817-2415(-)